VHPVANIYLIFRDASAKKDDVACFLPRLVQLCVNPNSFSSRGSCSSGRPIDDGPDEPREDELIGLLKSISNLPGPRQLFCVDPPIECPNFPSTLLLENKALMILRDLIDLRLPTGTFCHHEAVRGRHEMFSATLGGSTRVIHEESGQTRISSTISTCCPIRPRCGRWREEAKKFGDQDAGRRKLWE